MRRVLTSVGRSAGRWALRAALACSLALSLFLGAGQLVGSYRIVTVLSGSMSPGMPPGSAAVIRQVPVSSLAVGDVVTYVAPIPGRPVVTHRIVRLQRTDIGTILHTKGDANRAADPWQARLTGRTAWERVAVVPYLGTLVHDLRAPLVHDLTLYGGTLTFLLFGLRWLWRKPRHNPKRPAEGPGKRPLQRPVDRPATVPRPASARLAPTHARRRVTPGPALVMAGLLCGVALAIRRGRR